MAIVDGQIRCGRCERSLPLASFPPSAVRNGHGRCSRCSGEVSAAKRATDREGVNAASRAWYAANRDKHLARTQAIYRRDTELSFGRHLKRRYGISLADYKAMLDRQGGGCAICCKRQGTEKNRLAVDHDHETGVVRGLLCHQCNRALGTFGDSLDGVRRVTAYLERSQQLPFVSTTPALRINLLPGAN